MNIDFDDLKLEDALLSLTERERYVVKRLFFGKAKRKQVSAELRVSKSRVSQIRMKALRKLKHPSRWKYYFKGKG